MPEGDLNLYLIHPFLLRSKSEEEIIYTCSRRVQNGILVSTNAAASPVGRLRACVRCVPLAAGVMATQKRGDAILAARKVFTVGMRNTVLGCSFTSDLPRRSCVLRTSSSTVCCRLQVREGQVSGKWASPERSICCTRIPTYIIEMNSPKITKDNKSEITYGHP
jgi:hypothetical protein